MPLIGTPIAMLLVFLIASSCNRPYSAELQIIDSKNGAPVEGVHARHYSHNLNMLWSSPQRPIEVRPSDAAGRVSVSGLSRNRSHGFELQKEGYLKATVLIGGPRPRDVLIISPDSEMDGRQARSVPRQGIVVVPLHRNEGG